MTRAFFPPFRLERFVVCRTLKIRPPDSDVCCLVGRRRGEEPKDVFGRLGYEQGTGELEKVFREPSVR